jgi:hypothetical protein
MVTARQIAANRRNAHRTTGPRSRGGRKRSSRNSFRHGLAAGVTANAERIKRVERLARKIADGASDLLTLECARTIAQAEFDLAQVRRVKAAVMSRVMLSGGFETPNASQSLGQLKSDEAERVKAPRVPKIEPNGTADAIRIALSELIILDRYERRAAARRARALRILLDRKKDRTT